MNQEKTIALAKAVLETEAQAVLALKDRIGDNFIQACHLLLNCQGRIVVIGMGKSGHIGNKIAATLASTGSPAFFVHPGEASHGDLGMIRSDDVVIAISNSGEASEILVLLPLLKRYNVPLISMTGKPDSTMACAAAVNLDVAVKHEACPLGLAPTASTTATLAMGDALAVALLENRGFTAEDFALSHPGGALGRRLLLRVSDIMSTGDQIPIVHPSASIRDALLEMTQKGLGFVIITDHNQKQLGIFTDGDLRRLLDSNGDLKNQSIDQVMTPEGRYASAEQLAADVLKMMEDHAFNSLSVLDHEHHVIGALNMHSLLRAQVI